jgi:hypothetical protein
MKCTAAFTKIERAALFKIAVGPAVAPQRSFRMPRVTWQALLILVALVSNGSAESIFKFRSRFQAALSGLGVGKFGLLEPQLEGTLTQVPTGQSGFKAQLAKAGDLAINSSIIAQDEAVLTISQALRRFQSQ